MDYYPRRDSCHAGGNPLNHLLIPPILIARKGKRQKIGLLMIIQVSDMKLTVPGTAEFFISGDIAAALHCGAESGRNTAAQIGGNWRRQAMIHVLASIRVIEGRRAEFIEIFKANVPNVLNEDGCIEYAPAVDFPTGIQSQEMNKNMVTIVEKWESFEHLQAHLSAPHMKSYQEKVKDMVEHVGLKVLGNAW
jgi:quinol monooxygenase YgiN